jgi:hypothetical protein
MILKLKLIMKIKKFYSYKIIMIYKSNNNNNKNSTNYMIIKTSIKIMI